MNYNKILLAGLIAATLVFASLTIYISLLEKTVKQAPPTTTVDIQPTIASSSIFICEVAKAGNPLVQEVSDPVPGLRQIDYRGVLKSITFQKDQKIAFLAVSSYDGLQTYTFEASEEEPVYLIGDNTKKLTELKFADNLMLTYNCKPGEQNSKMRLSRITFNSSLK